MADDSSDNNDSVQNQSSEPHVVVGCPSCQTKFAVESSLVASYENPKFHCSRCDAVFEITPPRHPAVETTTAKDSQRWVLSDSARGQTTNPFSQPTTKETTLKSSDFTLGESNLQEPSESRKPFAPLAERAGLSLLGLRPSAGPALTSTLTRQEALSRETPAPHQATTDSSNNELDPFALFDAPGTHPSTPENPTPATPLKAPTTTSVTVNATPPKQQAPIIEAQPELDSQVAEQPRSTVPGLWRATLARLSVRNRGLAQLSMPLIAMMGFFCILNYAGQLVPQTLDTVLKATVPSILTGKVSQLPPSELVVEELSFDFEKTQSKETLPIVRGVIHNTGERTVEEILVEALGFNARGEVVVHAKAPLRSALAREKISDLPLATVKKFQTSLSARNSTIGAGEKVAFSIALLSDTTQPDAISYFSARIFSVGASRR